MSGQGGDWKQYATNQPTRKYNTSNLIHNFVYFLCLHQMLQIVWWLSSLWKMVASLASTHRPYRYVIQHNLFFSLHAKIILKLGTICFTNFFCLTWSILITKLLLCRDVYLPFQININIFQLFINLLRNLIDSPKICILLLVNYYMIICFAWYTVLLQVEGPVSCKNLFLILLMISIKYVQNKHILK